MKYGYSKLILVHSVETLINSVDDNAAKTKIANEFGKVGMSVMVDADNDVHVYIDVRDRGYLAGVASAAYVKHYTDSDVVNNDDFEIGVSATLAAFAAAIAITNKARR